VPHPPRSPGELFSVFTRLALQGFGGVLPVAQRELVERQRWLDPEEFLALLSVAQVLPGPNIVNLALMVGHRFLGWRGALAATTGILLAPLCLVLVLAVVARQLEHLPTVTAALRGMGVVASGLILSTALRLVGGLGKNPLGKAGCTAFTAATAVAVGVLRWPLAAVVLGLGVVAVALAWWRLRDA
jgi:chromate transporter